jgi:hypothetical protein
MLKPPKRSPRVVPWPDVVAVGGALVVGGGGTVVAGAFVVAGDVGGADELDERGDDDALDGDPLEGDPLEGGALEGGAVTSGCSAMYRPRMARAAWASDWVGRLLLATATVTAPARKLRAATIGTTRRLMPRHPPVGSVGHAPVRRARQGRRYESRGPEGQAMTPARYRSFIAVA